MNSDYFASKILLFGEYAIIKGSRGLAIPLSKFQGCFKKSPGKIQKGLKLDEFCEYLKGSSILSDKLDLVSFSKDIQEGQYFDSNIPQGYGVGSSGALCAAVYAKYARGFVRRDFYSHAELKLLKDMMALMESFYHGTSSGVDCLISLIDKPILIENRNTVNLISSPDLSKFGAFYLYDCGAGRETQAFVHDFLKNYEQDPSYHKAIESFVELTNRVIDDFSGRDQEAFESSMRKYSEVQFKYFHAMIPETVKAVWEKGLESNSYYMKLCGAGGGGYFIVYARDDEFSKNHHHIEL